MTDHNKHDELIERKDNSELAPLQRNYRKERNSWQLTEDQKAIRKLWKQLKKRIGKNI